MPSDPEVSYPFHQLQFALEDIGALTVAHFNMVEKRSSLEKWVIDQSSIFTKSGVTFLCSVWEAFVEDCAKEATNHLVKKAKSHTDLPINLQRIIARELKDDRHELAIWSLASDGWRHVATERLTPILEKRLNKMNTPKSLNVCELFKESIGIDNIDQSWNWGFFDADKSKHWLDRFVEARGAIAHGREPNFQIGAFSLDFLTCFIREVARLTHNRTREFLLNIISEPIWPQMDTAMESWDVFLPFKNTEVPPHHVSIFRPKTVFPALYSLQKDFLEQHGIEWPPVPAPEQN